MFTFCLFLTLVCTLSIVADAYLDALSALWARFTAGVTAGTSDGATVAVAVTDVAPAPFRGLPLPAVVGPMDAPAVPARWVAVSPALLDAPAVPSRWTAC